MQFGSIYLEQTATGGLCAVREYIYTPELHTALKLLSVLDTLFMYEA